MFPLWWMHLACRAIVRGYSQAAKRALPEQLRIRVVSFAYIPKRVLGISLPDGGVAILTLISLTFPHQ